MSTSQVAHHEPYASQFSDRTLGETLTSVGEYSIGKKLGEGEFARVHECKMMSEDEKQAIDEGDN